MEWSTNHQLIVGQLEDSWTDSPLAVDYLPNRFVLGRFFFLLDKLTFLSKPQRLQLTLQKVYNTKLEPRKQIHYHTNQATYCPHIAQSQQKGKSLTNTRTNNETMKHRKNNSVIYSLPTLSMECPNFHKAQHSLSCNWISLYLFWLSCNWICSSDFTLLQNLRLFLCFQILYTIAPKANLQRMLFNFFPFQFISSSFYGNYKEFEHNLTP